MKCDRCQQEHLEVRTITVPDSQRVTTVLCVLCWGKHQLWLRTPPAAPGERVAVSGKAGSAPKHPWRFCPVIKQGVACQLIRDHTGLHYASVNGFSTSWL